MPIEIKTKILSKLDIIKNLDKNISEFYKIKSFIEGILKIPFEKYCATNYGRCWFKSNQRNFLGPLKRIRLYMAVAKY